MGIPGAANPLLLASAAAAASGYQIERSLRFNSADSAYLNRTPASAGNRKTWTFSCWVKRASLGRHVLLSAYINSTNYAFFQFSDNDQLLFEPYSNAVTNAVFRDFSAWYHIVCTVDTTLATRADRVKIYANGALQTLSASTSIGQNVDTVVNSTNIHNIASGYYGTPGVYVNGYLADIHFIDGQALTPSSFGETDDNGVWQPKAYTGTYGTNGFRLNFSDNSTAAALGTDTSGNGNNWTPNNLSVTAGSGNDSLVDTPTSYGTDTGIGGEARGNYATFNPLAKSSNSVFSNGSLEAVWASTNQNTAAGAISTIQVTSGKWYWEFMTTGLDSGYPYFGFFIDHNPSSQFGAQWIPSFVSGASWQPDGTISTLGCTKAANAGAYGVNDILGFALDRDAGTLQVYKNGAAQNSGNAVVTGITGVIGPGVGLGIHGPIIANFGQRPFAYTAPSGFKALCTQNLPEGTITTSGTFTGNANADGPFVYLNGVPTAMTINGNAVTFATNADKLSNGFKLRTNSSSYNTSGGNTYSVSTTGSKFKYARAQPNP